MLYEEFIVLQIKIMNAVLLAVLMILFIHLLELKNHLQSKMQENQSGKQIRIKFVEVTTNVLRVLKIKEIQMQR